MGKLMRHLHAHLGILVDKADEISLRNKICLRELHGFNRCFAGSPPNHRSQPQHFARLGNPQNERLPFSGCG
jgi:hypothetical protein